MLDNVLYLAICFPLVIVEGRVFTLNRHQHFLALPPMSSLQEMTESSKVIIPWLQVAFLQQAVPMLDSLSFVERYAWYYLSPDQTYDGQNGLPLDTASLYNLNGSATPTGLAYQPY